MFEQHTDPYLGEVSRNFGLVLKEWRVMGTITRRPAKFSDLSWWAGLWSPVAVKRVLLHAARFRVQGAIFGFEGGFAPLIAPLDLGGIPRWN